MTSKVICIHSELVSWISKVLFDSWSKMFREIQLVSPFVWFAFVSMYSRYWNKDAFIAILFRFLPRKVINMSIDYLLRNVPCYHQCIFTFNDKYKKTKSLELTNIIASHINNIKKTSAILYFCQKIVYSIIIFYILFLKI